MFARIFPFALLIAALVAESALRASPWRDAVDLRWVTVARGLATGAALAWLWPRYSELERPPRASHLILAIVTGLLVFAAWITFDRGWAVLGDGGTGFVATQASGALDIPLALLRLAGFALAVPIAEELFWRSFLLRWIDRKDFLACDPQHVSARAFAISSALFAAEHSQWIAGLMAGAAYTWVYKRTGNLWVPIVSHAITNGTLGLWILAGSRWTYW
jgi:hypothetical protein